MSTISAKSANLFPAAVKRKLSIDDSEVVEEPLEKKSKLEVDVDGGEEEIKEIDEEEPVVVAADDDDEEVEEEEEDDGCVKLSVPKAAPKAVVIPTDENVFLNPNATVAYFSKKHGLGVHYTELNPEKHFAMDESLPDPKKKIVNQRAFHRVVSSKRQMFDFQGGTNFKQPLRKTAMAIGAFGLGKFTAMYPYGNRWARPGSNFAPPESAGGFQFKLPISNEEYSPLLSHVKDKVGEVDNDQAKFQSSWVRGKMEPWLLNASWTVAKNAFPLALSTLESEIDNKFTALNEAHAEALEKFLGSNKKQRSGMTNPIPPDTSAARKEELLREAFIGGAFKPIVKTKDSKSFSTVPYSAPVYDRLSVKERDNPAFVPDIPADDAYSQALFKNPPKWNNPKKREEWLPGYPLKPHDLPLFACVTPQMAQAIVDKKAPANPSCMRLIPHKDRFVEDDDVTAPIIEWTDKFDSPGGSGWYWRLIGILWLGPKSAMQGTVPPAVAGACPTSYFRLAQPYTRTKENYTMPVYASDSSAAAAAAPHDPDHAGFAS